MNKKGIAKASGFALAASAVAGTTAYLTTRILMRTAMDRQAPKLMQGAGGMISGSVVDEEIYRQKKDAAEKLEATPMETVSIASHDGIELVGHWYPCDAPKRIVIAMHGWRSSWCGDFGLIADFLHENQCSILFPEQRAQGNSGGEYMGFGVAERYDCLEWVRWVAENKSPELPIYLSGVSMGATTVLMTAGLELPDNVHGIVADCGFTSPEAIWKHITTNNLHLSYRLHRLMVESIYQRKSNDCSFDYSTTDALRSATAPVLLVHGTDDHFVPIEMSYENYIACASPKRLLVVPGADHGMSYLVDQDGYETAVKSFWKEFD